MIQVTRLTSMYADIQKDKFTTSNLREVLQVCKSVLASTAEPELPTRVLDILTFVETALFEWVLDQIRQRQDKIEGLTREERGFIAYLGKGLTPGCHTCLYGNLTHVRHSSKCTQECLFCYYNGLEVRQLTKDRYVVEGNHMTAEEAELFFHRQGDQIQAVGWLQKEPLMEMDKMATLMRSISKRGVHQYLYTNGVHATEENCKILHDSGLQEIRFNLMASKFSGAVLNNMKVARKYFDYLCVETPIYGESRALFEKRKERVLDTALDQINMAELQLTPASIKSFEGEGPVYRHRLGYTSPISSRHHIYDLIEMAARESWPVTINDCSNETKFARGISRSAPFGEISYETCLNLPYESYLYALDNVLEEDKAYEIF